MASPTTTTTPPASQALAEAKELLAPFPDHPIAGPILESLRAAPAPTEAESPPDPDDPDRLAKTLLSTRQAAAKCETPALRESLEKSARALELEHLGASNPRAAAAYEKARAA